MKAPVSLQGKKINLQPMEESDVEVLWNMINEPEVRPWWGNETREDIEELLTDKDVFVWAIKEGEWTVGMIQCYEELEPDYKHAGMDISLISEVHGKHYGREALRLVAKWLFDERGHHRLVIDPDADNSRAIAAYKAIGYKPVGIMRQYSREVGKEGWHNGLLLDLLKDEFIGEDNG